MARTKPTEGTDTKPMPPPAMPGNGDHESKHSKFMRLAEPRVTRAVKYIGLIGNLGASSYEKSEAEVTEILDALMEAVHDIKVRLEHKRSPNSGFKFKKK